MMKQAFRHGWMILAYGCVMGVGSARAETPLEDLTKLVNLNSGSAQVASVNGIQDWIGERLRALGFQVAFETDPNGKSGKLLIATKPGSVPSAKWTTLLVHADTVFEPSSPFQKITVSADGKTATGPGVIDDKGGIIVALRGLEEFLKTRESSRHSIRFVSSPSEETGSAAYLDRFRELSLDSWIVLSFEPALDGGAIIQGRRGDRWYHVRVTGKEAHAGRAHADGVNACVELADKLSAVSRLTDYKAGVTVSVGHIEGGKDKFNVVCGNAEAKIDARFGDLPSRDRLHRRIVAVLEKPGVKSAKTGERAQVSFTLADDCPPFSVSKKSQPFLDRYRAAIGAVEGKRPDAQNSGGAGDANYFSREGIVIVDGLGAVGGKMHTAEEFIEFSSLATRAQALSQFLADTEASVAK